MLAVMSLWLTGCANMVADRLLAFDSLEVSAEDQQQLIKDGFKTGRFCYQSQCLAYLEGQPIKANKLNAEWEIFGKLFQLNLKREQVTSQQGTVVMIHGYRMNKETMAVNALYWRFLGYRVLLPDLQGHGGATDEFSFGVRDGELLDAWLNRHNPKQPLLVIGNSMGAIAAVNLVKRRDDVSGLILQAPMMGLGDSLVAFPKPWYLSWVPEGDLRQGAQLALARLQLEESQVDATAQLSSLTLPILVLASDGDDVSPYAKAAPLSSDQVQVVNLPGLLHPQVGIIGNDEHQLLQGWLQTAIKL